MFPKKSAQKAQKAPYRASRAVQIRFLEDEETPAVFPIPLTTPTSATPLPLSSRPELRRSGVEGSAVHRPASPPGCPRRMGLLLRQCLPPLRQVHRRPHRRPYPRSHRRLRRRIVEVSNCAPLSWAHRGRPYRRCSRNTRCLGAMDMRSEPTGGRPSTRWAALAAHQHQENAESLAPEEEPAEAQPVLSKLSFWDEEKAHGRGRNSRPLHPANDSNLGHSSPLVIPTGAPKERSGGICSAPRALSNPSWEATRRNHPLRIKPLHLY
jgi:hypothetical protein